MPQAIIKGKGNYDFKQVVTFAITAKNIADEDVTIENYVLAANGKVQKKMPVVKWNKVTLKYNKNEAKSDYTVDFGIEEYKEAGVYTVTVTGVNNFTGTKTYTIEITDKKFISKASVKVTPNKVAYSNGENVKPDSIVVKYGRTTLGEGTDYKVVYPENHSQVGKVTVTIEGMGDYIGTKEATYTITGKSIATAKVTGIVSKVYVGGDAVQTGYKVMIGKTELTEGEDKDYVVEYQKNDKVGTAVMLIKGVNGYTGTIKKSFRVNAYDIKSDTEGLVVITCDSQAQYTKAGAKPSVKVTFKGTELVENVDYKLSYTNNKAVNDGSNAKKAPTVKITGKGNFKGVRTATFTITAGTFAECTMTAKDVAWKNKNNAYKSTPVIVDADGKRLTAGRDYEKALVYTYADGSAIEGKNIPQVDENGTVIKVTAKGIGNYAGSEIFTTYRVTKYLINSANVKVASKAFTGTVTTITKEDIKSIKVGKITLTTDDYEIVPGTYKNNTKVGTAKVTIKGVGAFGGSKEISFRINKKVK